MSRKAAFVIVSPNSISGIVSFRDTPSPFGDYTRSSLLPSSEYAPPKYRQQVPDDELVLVQKKDDLILMQKKMDTQALYIEALTQRIEDQALAIRDLEKVSKRAIALQHRQMQTLDKGEEPSEHSA